MSLAEFFIPSTKRYFSNNEHSSQEIALTNFLPFSSQKLSPEVGRTDYSQNLGLTYKRHEVTRNECQ